MKSKFGFIVLIPIIVSAIFIPIVTANPSIQSTNITYSEDNQNIKEKSIISVRGVEFTIHLNKDRKVIKVAAKNPTSKIANSHFALTLDDGIPKRENLSLEPGEMWRNEYNVTQEMKVTKSKHEITASTVGSYVTFNFTQEINSTNQNNVPTPTITDVTVRNGTIDGHPSSVADVTIKNPSIHTYPTKLMVHTQETDGSFYGASVPPGDSRTITVELLDERGQTIAGEARLYTGNLTTEEGAMDQIEFVGEANGNTSRWNASYEPINPPWMEEEYQYHNESLAEPSWAERVSRGYGIGGVPAIYVGIGSIVAALLAGVVRRTIYQ